ncbi:Homeobox protein Hox-A2 [Cyphomyrmex costatus]|uniref:Homeobox protein Hox-A2 n=1 Tax=Cyphomyrmex costatus TaxID=456900 RepID=A0A195CQ15_9HYME|nr:Homeobox protein Hox-A2 [Cyphomyrmex costatus]
MRSKQQTLVPEEDPRQPQLSSSRNLQLSNHLQNLVHASKELSTVKTRPTTPVLANDGGGGFWLATVAAGASTPAGLPPHGTHHPVMDPTCGSAETGFINSQPSMAEFMTALPQLAGDSSLAHSPGTGGSISPGAHHPAYHTMMDPHGVADPSGVNVPEYPWMKEKKTTRKSNQQGEEARPTFYASSVILAGYLFYKKATNLRVFFPTPCSRRLISHVGGCQSRGVNPADSSKTPMCQLIPASLGIGLG